MTPEHLIAHLCLDSRITEREKLLESYRRFLRGYYNYETSRGEYIALYDLEIEGEVIELERLLPELAEDAAHEWYENECIEEDVTTSKSATGYIIGRDADGKEVYRKKIHLCYEAQESDYKQHNTEY